MVLSRPAGAIAYTDGGLDIPSRAGDFNIVVGAHSCPIQPPFWASAQTETVSSNVTVYAQITKEAAKNLTLRFQENYGPDFPAAAESWTAAKSSAWTAVGTIIDHVDGKKFEATEITDEPERTLPHYAPNYLQITGDDGLSGTNEILGLYIENDFDDTYDGQGLSDLDYELTSRGTIKLYAKSMPFSSYQAKYLICGNLNRILYQSRQAWTVSL